MKRRLVAIGLMLGAIGATAFRVAGDTSTAFVRASPTPVVDWSVEAQRAIVPAPAGVGDKFPGEAAVYMGIVHAAMYDVAVAIDGGYRPYAIALTALADTAPAAAIASAAHGVLVGLLPTQIADLDRRYAEYLSRLPNNSARTNGVVLGEQVAAAILAMRASDGRTAEIEHQRRIAPRGESRHGIRASRAIVGLREGPHRAAMNDDQQWVPLALLVSLGIRQQALDLQAIARFPADDLGARRWR